MNWKTLALLAGIFCAVAGITSGWAEPSVNVPLDHWVYRFIERFEAKGILRGLGDGIKPFTRIEMARAINLVGQKAKQGGQLSRIEKEELQLLQVEFSDELAGLAGDVEPGEHAGSWRGNLLQGRSLYHYSHENGALFADLLFRQQADIFSGRGRQKRERIWRNRFGGTVRGHLDKKIAFYIGFEQGREQGSRIYVERDDIFEPRLEIPQLKGNLVDFHEGVSYAVFSLPHVDIQFGKDEVAWGPGPNDNLGLSDNASSFDMLRLRTNYGPFKLVSIAAALRPCPDRGDSPGCVGVGDLAASYNSNGVPRLLEREKYLAAHRLEVGLAPWIDLGFQEVVIYGDRGPELTYLNPLMFYWAAQSYLGDKDNLMMGLDVDVHPGNGMRWYLAYVVDDLKKLRIFSDDFANKFSFQSGLLWVDPLGLSDADLRAEYVRIEPWIYTHKIPINTFRHFDVPLGHELGPNSDRWDISWTQRFSRDLSAQLHLGGTRHGDNVLLEDGTILNVGGDLHRGWRPGDERQVKAFLDGNVSRWTALGGNATWRLLPQLTVLLGYQSEWGDDVPLPPRGDANVTLTQRTGYGDGRQQHIRFELRYRYF